MTSLLHFPACTTHSVWVRSSFWLRIRVISKLQNKLTVFLRILTFKFFTSNLRLQSPDGKTNFLTRDLLKISAHRTVIFFSLSVTLIESFLFALLQIYWKVLKCECLYLLSATNVVFRALMVLVHFQAEPFVPVFLLSSSTYSAVFTISENEFVSVLSLVRNLTPILRYSRWENFAIKMCQNWLALKMRKWFVFGDLS